MTYTCMDMDNKLIKEIEAMSQKLWENYCVFGDDPEPGVKLFRNFPVPEIKMDDSLDLERLVSHSKKEFCADYNRLAGDSAILKSGAEPLMCPSSQCFRESPTSIAQAIEEYSADALRFALADACDGSVVDPGLLYHTAGSANLMINREISWISTHVVGAQESNPCFRTGPPSCFADRAFANEINITVKIRLIAPICPHYAEYVWRELLNKEGFAVTAGWPTRDAPDDPILRSVNNYLRDLIHPQKVSRIRHWPYPPFVHLSASSSLNANNKKRRLVGLIYVREEYVGWEAECLRMLQENFDSDSSTFSDQLDDNVILKALLSRSRSISDDQPEDRKLNSMIFRDFLQRKKMMAVKLGAQALNFKMPFGEIEFLQENLDLIRELIDVEEVLVLSATNAEDLAKVGSDNIEKIRPPAPGIPTLVLWTCTEEMEHLKVWKSDKAGSDRSANDIDKSPTNLASLYCPPLKLMFQGSFEEAKHAASIQHKWLLVNLQSLKEFSSHLLNRDTWANEAVSQIISSNFIFWQEYDDTDEGRNVCTYYKLERMPVVLIIDPITGQNLHSWNQMVQPERLLEDLLPLLESHPGNDHI
ncbi:hypothetical protein ACLB2K_055276 [Fragaria x ananassa]